MRRLTRTTVARLALVAVVLALGAPFAAVASAQDADDPWTVALGSEQIAALAADVQRDAVAVEGLEPRAVFGGDVVGDGVVTTEMTIGQTRYLLPGSVVTSGLAAMAEIDQTMSHWTIHSTGLEDYFSTSTTTNVVVVTVPSGTLSCSAGEYAEVAVFELYPGTSTIAANPAIPNDPGVGASSAYSVVCTDGETAPFFGIANKGALQQYAPGVGIVEVNLAEVDAYLFFSPRDVDLRVAQSGAPDLTVPEVDVVTAPDGRYGPSEPVDPTSVPTDPSEYEEETKAFLLGLLEALSADPVEMSDTPAGVPADDVSGVPSEEAAPAEDQVVVDGEGTADGPAEVAIDLNSPDEAPADGFAWEYVLVGAVVILGITFYYFRWTQKKKDSPPAAPARLAYGPGDSHDPEKARAYMIAVAEGAVEAGADTDGTRVTVRPVDFFRHDEHGRLVPGEIRRFVVHSVDIHGGQQYEASSAVMTAAFGGELMANLSLPRPARDRDDITMQIDCETGEVFITDHEPPPDPEEVAPISMENEGDFLS